MSRFSGLLVFLALAVLFAACDVGLGEMVNTEKPMISSVGDDSAPGAFLQSDENGQSRIEFEVKQDFGLEEVYADVTYREKQPDGTIITKTGRFPAKRVPGTDIWYVDLPTGDWADGKFTVQVTAIDVSGNTNTPPELVYYIKNSAPQIELSIPKVQGRQFDDVKTHENGELYYNPDYLDNMADTQGILQGNSIVGMATDLRGIKAGYPQIVIWPAEEINPETNARFVVDGVPVYSRAYPNVQLDPVTKLPFDADDNPIDTVWGHWNTAVNEEWVPVNSNPDYPETAVQFRWPMVKLLEGGKLPERENAEVLAVGDYNIMFRIYDTMEKENKNTFPNRVENPLYTPELNPRKFMTISVTSATNPIVRVEETPSYYNPNRTFVGAISIEIPSMSPLQAIYTRFSLRDRTSLIDEDEDVYPLTPGNVNDDYTNGRTITLDPAQVIAHLGGNNSGEKFWLIRIKTMNGDKADISRPVIFDAVPPYVNLIQPQGFHNSTETSGPEVTSTVTIRGSALDNQLVDKMYYSLGVRETGAVTPASETSLTDNTGWTDTRLGRECFGPPVNSGDPQACPVPCNKPEHLPLDIHPDMSLSGPPAWFNVRSAWGQDGILPSWSWEFADVYDFTQGTNAENKTGNYYVSPHDVGYNMWRLPIWFKVVDKAGNITITKRMLILDPDRDSPRTEISVPSDGAVVGGQVRVSGTAEDNEWIHSMEVRVSKRNFDTGALQEYVIGGPNDNTGTDGWVRISENMGNDHAYSGNKIDGGQAISWLININKDGSLTPVTGQQRVLVEVRARDQYLLTADSPDPKPLPGIVKQITLKFDPGVPVIDYPRIIYTSYNDYYTNKGDLEWLARNTQVMQPGIVPKVRDTVIFEYLIKDDGDISSIKTRIAGAWSDELINRSTPSTAGSFVIKQTPAAQTTNNEYLLYVPINTNTVNGNAYDIDEGLPNNFNFDIEAIDNADNMFSTRVNTAIQIDNFYPLAKVTGRLTAVGDYEIQGKAWDTSQGNARVFGIERVVVYLAKDDGANSGYGTYISLNGGSGTSGYIEPPFWPKRGRTGTEPMGDTLSVIGDKGVLTKLSAFPTVEHSDGTFKTNNFGIVVSADTSGSKEESKTGGYNIGWNTGSFVTWSVTINTLNPLNSATPSSLADGKYVLHYVVFDQAGNASHFYDKIYVANNRPVITNIELGTDSNYNDTVDSGEFTRHVIQGTNSIYKESAPYFRVQNRRFELNINTTGGNGQKHYRVYHVTKDTARSTAMTAGKVYTIGKAGDIEWFNYGVPVWQNTKASYEGYTFKATKTITSLPSNVDLYGYSDPADAVLASGSFPVSGDTANAIKFGFPPASGLGNDTQGAFGLANGNTPEANVPVKDSTGVRLEKGRIEWNRTGADARYFIVHVFDSTHSPAVNNDDQRADQLSHVELVNIGITNKDTMAPLLQIAPIGQHYELAAASLDYPFPTLANYENRVIHDLPSTVEGYNHNVVTAADGKRMGYVQYTAHKTSATRPDVSGMVIFKGKAMDNNVINRITAAIPGYDGGSGAGVAFDIAVTSGGVLVPANTAYTMANMKNGANPWAFETTEADSSVEYGNVINWNFAWDTSLHSSVVASNVTITFRVYDAAGNANVITSPLAPVTINFDIVPYISEVVTPLSDAFKTNVSAFNRSANGWYPVRENDTIEIKGFNLNGTSTHVLVGATRFTPTIVDSKPRTHLSFNIGTAAVSGALKVNVGGTAGGTGNNTVTGGTDSINNTNNVTAGRVGGVVGTGYNDEPNNFNNNRLTDDRYLFVWNTGPTHRINRLNIFNPAFKMDPNSNWYMSYGTYGSTSVDGATATGGTHGLVRAVKNTVATNVERETNRYLHTAIAYDAAGDWYVAASNMTSATNTYYMTFFPRQAANGATASTNQTAEDTKRRLSPMDAIADRYQLPRIAVQHTNGTIRGTNDNSDKILISYYDGRDNILVFHHGTVGANNNFGGNFGANNATTTRQIVANDSTSATTAPHRGSIYSAVGYLSTGRAVIAWYDRTNQNLVFSYGNAAPSSNVYNNAGAIVTTSQTQWQANARIIHKGAGSHVDLAVDSNNVVHLAYYDVFNGGLYYARIPYDTTNARPNIGGGTVSATALATNVQVVRVDTCLSAGTQLQISVRNNIPYISYYHASFAETKNAIRVAWLKGSTLAHGTYGTNNMANANYVSGYTANTNFPADSFTGEWEVMTVPAGDTPTKDDIVSIGVPTANTPWSTAANRGPQYLTGTTANRLRAAPNAIETSVFVGFWTSLHHEGAYLKHNIIGMNFAP